MNSIKIIITNVPIDKCHCWLIFYVCVIWKHPVGREQWDSSQWRKVIFKVELPTRYSCADNYHTHKLEMTTNKFISDQGLMLVFIHSLSLKATTISQKIFAHINLLEFYYYSVTMTERHSLLYYCQWITKAVVWLSVWLLIYYSMWCAAFFVIKTLLLKSS